MHSNIAWLGFYLTKHSFFDGSPPAQPSPKMQNNVVSQTIEPLACSSLDGECAGLTCLPSQSQSHNDLQPGIRRGFFAIPPVLAARSCWELHECKMSILFKTKFPANTVCLADIHVFLPFRTPAASHAFNLAVKLYQHSKDIQIVVKSFMQRTREKLLMSDVEAPLSPGISLEVRHGFMGL